MHWGKIDNSSWIKKNWHVYFKIFVKHKMTVEMQGKSLTVVCSFKPIDLFSIHLWFLFQVSLNGLEIISLLIDRMGEDFKHHVNTGKPFILAFDLHVDNRNFISKIWIQLFCVLACTQAPPSCVNVCVWVCVCFCVPLYTYVHFMNYFTL